jgi:hypothetical protein
MIKYPWRQIKRFAVLFPGLIVAYFSVRTVFPFIDRKLRLGDALSIIVTYIIAAYVLVPALIRFFRILKPPEHLPLYCVTPDGFASDPLNVGIIGTRRQLIHAMEKSGWYITDPYRGRFLIKHFLSIVLGRPYETAPVSNLYLFGRKHDLAFEIPVEGASAASRHHVRFWATTFENKKPLTFKSIYWHHRRSHIKGDNLLWVGAASLDVGINLIRHNMQLSHMIDPDTNKERKLIVEQLSAQKLVKKVELIKLGKPYRLINRVWKGSLHTDVKMAIISLRKKN